MGILCWVRGRQKDCNSNAVTRQAATAPECMSFPRLHDYTIIMFAVHAYTLNINQRAAIVIAQANNTPARLVVGLVCCCCWWHSWRPATGFCGENIIPGSLWYANRSSLLSAYSFWLVGIARAFPHSKLDIPEQYSIVVCRHWLVLGICVNNLF